MYNILVCDDEKDIVSALTIYLTTAGYQVFPAYDGTEALDLLRREDIHLVLLDIMMPKLDGIAALTRLREASNVPVILLTAKSEDTDKIQGLNLGADDYVTKPFNPVEVLARVKSQLRRYLQLGGGTVRPTALRLGGIALDDRTKEVTLDGDPVSLTPREYDILHLLMGSPGTVFSPKRIYRAVWGEEPFGVENAVAVHIRHLREKLEIDPSDPRYIKVVWGRGTRWKGENHETKLTSAALGQDRRGPRLRPVADPARRLWQSSDDPGPRGRVPAQRCLSHAAACRARPGKGLHTKCGESCLRSIRSSGRFYAEPCVRNAKLLLCNSR